MSAIIEQKRAELLKKGTVPKVNLPALARRDERLMSCLLPAQEDHVFISSDFTALEPSITSQYSKDEYYSYASYHGVGKRPYIDEKGVLRISDIYLMFASVDPRFSKTVTTFFSDPANCQLWLDNPDKIKEDLLKRERKLCKPAVLGFGYGMSAKRFVSQSFDAGNEVTLAEARAAHKAYWTLFAGIRKFSKTLEVLTKKQGFIENPFGYRLTTEPHKGYNAFVQSSASGVVDLLCLHFFPTCPEATFVSLVHDEIIYSCHKKDVEICRQKQEESVKWLNDTLQFDIPMRLGFIVAKSFKEVK